MKDTSSQVMDNGKLHLKIPLVKGVIPKTQVDFERQLSKQGTGNLIKYYQKKDSLLDYESVRQQ